MTATKPTTLAIGVTVGLRKAKGTVYDYFEQSVHSARRAGFAQTIHAFVEPGAACHVPDDQRWNLRVIENDKTLGCFRNFKHGLSWLYENTDADWLLMLQDDAVWRRDGHERMMAAVGDPANAGVGMLSPYTSASMVAGGKRTRSRQAPGSEPPADRWAPARFYNKAFWGAVAMAFPRASAGALLEDSERFRTHKHTRKLDVVVGNALVRELNLRVLVHVPSLVDHIGSWSTLGRHRLKGNAWGRRGYLFREK